MSKKSRTKKSAPKTTGRSPAGEKLRNAVLAEIAGRQSDEVPPAKEVANTPGKKAKAPKAPKAANPKRVSALDAAARVLVEVAKPMQAKALIEQMAAQGLWTSPGGKTPEATLYAAMMREINTKNSEARFRKVDRGLFEATPAAKKAA